MWCWWLSKNSGEIGTDCFGFIKCFFRLRTVLISVFFWLANSQPKVTEVSNYRILGASSKNKDFYIILLRFCTQVLELFRIKSCPNSRYSQHQYFLFWENQTSVKWIIVVHPKNRKQPTKKKWLIADSRSANLNIEGCIMLSRLRNR